jgi:hypothetical protein
MDPPNENNKDNKDNNKDDDLELQAIPQRPPDMERQWHDLLPRKVASTQWHDSPQTSLSDMMDDSPSNSTATTAGRRGRKSPTEDEDSHHHHGTTTKKEAGDDSAAGTSTTDEPLNKRTWGQAMKHFYFQNQFLAHLCIAIGVARAYPTMGVEYVAPNITAGWIAVAIIFCKCVSYDESLLVLFVHVVCVYVCVCFYVYFIRTIGQ